jgi:hypothetical protein
MFLQCSREYDSTHSHPRTETMGSDRQSNSRAILEQLFWAGAETPSQRVALPPAEAAPHEPATGMSPQTDPQPAKPDRVLGTATPSAVNPGEGVSQLDVKVAEDRDEPKVDGPDFSDLASLRIPPAPSPSIQPIQIEDAAMAQFQIELHDAPLTDAWIRCLASPARPSSAA